MNAMMIGMYVILMLTVPTLMVHIIAFVRKRKQLSITSIVFVTEVMIEK